MQANDYYKLRSKLQYYRGRRDVSRVIIDVADEELNIALEAIENIVYTLNLFEAEHSMPLSTENDDA